MGNLQRSREKVMRPMNMIMVNKVCDKDEANKIVGMG